MEVTFVVTKALLDQCKCRIDAFELLATYRHLFGHLRPLGKKVSITGHRRFSSILAVVFR